MVSNPHLSTVNPVHEGFSVSGVPFLDLVSQTPRPRGRGRPLSEVGAPICHIVPVSYAYEVGEPTIRHLSEGTER